MSIFKGALISFMPASGIGIPGLPNVIMFQYNPESITHGWTEAASPPPKPSSSEPDKPKSDQNPLAVAGVPGETFTFTLKLDSNQQIADGSSDPIGAGLATVSGVYTRLAALEMLQFPPSASGSGLVGQISSGISSANLGLGPAQPNTIPSSQVPIVLFVWGPFRIVPVRVTALSVSEKLYDSLLNPTQADVQITLTVLTPEVLATLQGSVMGDIAITAYNYTLSLRQAEAAANLAESAASIIGMLPISL